MLIAKSKINLDKISDDFFIAWLPYIKIKYKRGRKTREMCFDALIPTLIKDPHAYVIFMRNPRDFKIIDSRPSRGILIEKPLTSGKQIFKTLLDLRGICEKFIEAAQDSLRHIARSVVLQLILPAQGADAKKLSVADEYLRLFSIIDAAGFNYDSEYIEETLLYWPILVHRKENVVFEPALKTDPSFSYTALNKKYSLEKLILRHKK